MISMATRLRILFIIAVGGCIAAGCRNTRLPDALVFTNEEVAELPLVMPGNPRDALYHGLNKGHQVAAFYRASDHHPAWVTDNDVSADSLIAFLRQIRYFGLLPQSYHLAEISFLKGQHVLLHDEQLRLDALLTDAFLNLAHDLRSGRLSPSDSARDLANRILLRDVVAHGRPVAALVSQEPAQGEYQALKLGLRKLIDQANALERELLLEGTTLDSIPLHRTVRTVEINLERWRWEKVPLGTRYILVNIPSFTVAVIAENARVLVSRAIVGKPQNQTPVFSSVVECVVTYPYWHVPRSISVGEFLPRIKKDTSFIRRNDFDVLDRKGQVLSPDSVDWNRFSKHYFPVTLRQREGPENSLGVIKFVFDNPFAVFLHDTNAPRLFRNKDRALSHGCVRVEKAVELAHLLVTGEVGKKSPTLEDYLHQKLRHNVNLAKPIPVHLRYFTAAGAGDKLQLFDDIYKKDQALADRFYGTAARRALP